MHVNKDKFDAEDQFLNLISKACCVPDHSDIVSLFYKCMRLSYEEGYYNGMLKNFMQLEKDIHKDQEKENINV